MIPFFFCLVCQLLDRLLLSYTLSSNIYSSGKHFTQNLFYQHAEWAKTRNLIFDFYLRNGTISVPEGSNGEAILLQ